MGVNVINAQPAKTQRVEPQRTSQSVSSYGASLSIDSPIHKLQRAVGNRGMNSLLRSRVIQPKLTVSQPDDEYEREADRVADQVMRMPDSLSYVTSYHTQPVIQRVCTECEKEEETIQAKEISGHTPEVTADVQAQINSLRGSGQPLPESVRAFFEPRFGVNFSGVRVHANSQAAQLARAINAQAFTIGQDVVFGAEQYGPETSAGRRLLAHELVHTVQQARAGSMLGRRPADIQAQGDCSQQSTDEAKWANQNPGKAFGVADPSSTDPPSNELILWNYCVGESRQRSAHQARLKEAATRWHQLLVKGTGPGKPPRRDLKIKILGTASRSGIPAANERLALERANGVRDFLKSQNIPEDRIIVEGVGSRFPLADETSPENMARNRRVEVFLFVPTPTIGGLGPSVDADVSKLVIKKADLALPPPSFKGNQFIRQAIGAEASAHVNLTSMVSSAGVGFLQFLVKDVRLGLYQSSNNELLLDYARCFTLPCRDVDEATNQFSIDKHSLFLDKPGSVSGIVRIQDLPSTAFPLRYPDPKSGPFVLTRYFWSMDFDLMVGVRSAGFLMPLQSASWSVAAAEEVDVSRRRTSGLAPVAVVTEDWRPGAPSRVPSIEGAMAGKTCKLMTRSIEIAPAERPCRPVEI